MNSVSLVGRLTSEPKVRYSNGDNPMCVARFNVAVNRRTQKDGQQNADFPSCVAFGKTAEFIEKYFTKGMAIGINGRLQTGSYTNRDGATVYTTEVNCENVEFVEKKSSGDGGSTPNNKYGDHRNFDVSVDDDSPEELPFA